MEEFSLSKRIQALSPEKLAILEGRLKKFGKKDFQHEFIPTLSDRSVLKLSFAQERLWFLDQFYPNSSAYNILSVIPLSGPLNIKALKDSLNEIVRRHEALRTTFDTVEGTLQQIIAPDLELLLSEVDLTSMPEKSRPTEAQRLIEQDSLLPFDLTNGPLLRCTLLSLADMNHVLILTMHHIISDGWTLGVFFQELSSLYNAFSAGRPSPLKELPIQYADFAAWQRGWLHGDTLNNFLAYWKQNLEGAPTILELPTDRLRPTRQTFQGAAHYFQIPKPLTDGLQELAHQEKATLFMVLLSTFAVLLNRYTHQADLLIGSPIANRTRPEIEELIGFFVNMLVLRCDLSGQPNFRQLIGRVREMALGAYAHQDLPFERLVEELQPERNLSHNPIIQVMFVFQNIPNTTQNDQTSAPVDNSKAPPQTGTGTSKFDLTLFMTEGPNGLTAGFEYNLALFDASTIERMASHLYQLITSLLANPDQSVSTLPLLATSERQKIVQEWNATEEEYPAEKCIHELFEEQAQKTPDAIAVSFREQQLTYQELDRRANKLSQYLYKQGIRPETPVGLCMDRSLNMMVALLGILKSGGAYVPLDPSYPEDRLEYMLKDSKASIVLSDETYQSKLTNASVELIVFEKTWPAISEKGEGRCPNVILSQNLAYIIYTSGSTGKPKGVALEHTGLINVFLSIQKFLNRTPEDRILQYSSLSFDASLFEILMSWSEGSTLFLEQKDQILPGTDLVDYLRDNEITTVTFPPSTLEAIPQSDLPKLRTVITAGEPCSFELVSEWAPDRQFFNAYGLTEASIWSSITSCDSSNRKLTIGKPINNTQLYILDENLNPVPVGIIGEIYIGGIGLSRGYINLPKLTAEKFIPNPFSDHPGERLFKTGDLGLYHDDGDIKYIGRRDHQVKLRGFRIELGEIESVLRGHEQVSTAIVLAQEDLVLGKQLIAYVKLTDAASITAKDLRRTISEKLPHYMIPSSIVLMEEWPLLSNGKVNRKALTKVNFLKPEEEREHIGPRNAVEEVLIDVWKNVLGIEKIGVQDNFFEIGGQSLIATQVISRIKDVFKIKLPILSLFEKPTVADLAQNLLENPSYNREKIEKTAEMLIRLTKLSESEIEQLLQKKLSSTKK